MKVQAVQNFSQNILKWDKNEECGNHWLIHSCAQWTPILGTWCNQYEMYIMQHLLVFRSKTALFFSVSWPFDWKLATWQKRRKKDLVPNHFFSLISVDKETKGKKRDSPLEPKHPLSTEHPTQMCHCCIIDDCTVVCALYKVICTLYCLMQTLYPRLHAVDSTFYTVAFWWRSKQRSVWSKKSGQQRVRRLRVWAASVWRTFHW